jgi:hypothetical protein
LKSTATGFRSLFDDALEQLRLGDQALRNVPMETPNVKSGTVTTRTSPVGSTK